MGLAGAEPIPSACGREWLDAYPQLCSFMLTAAQGTSPWLLVEELEPLREHLASRFAFAEVISERKVTALRASRGG